jgi:hypothetical protein
MSLVSSRPLLIPPAVLAMNAPSLNAKALLADILDLHKVSGHVFARDDYFAERYQIGKRSVGDALQWLEANGWITRELDHSARNKRNLIPTEQALALLEKSLQNSQPLSEEQAESTPTACEIRHDSMRNPQGVHAKSADISKNLNYKGNNTHSDDAAPAAACEQEEGLLAESAKKNIPLKATVDPDPVNTRPAAPAAMPADFDTFWEAYAKKQDRHKCSHCWTRLSAADRAAALAHVPGYVQATPVKRYRKNPLTYLHGRCWLDDLPDLTPTAATSSTTTPLRSSLDLAAHMQAQATELYL